jgi:hypothetical protein
MPNWCLNKIKISGDKNNRRRVSQIIEKLQEQDDNEIGLMESLVGREPTISEEDYNNGGWYDSNINYWGTKWDLTDNDFIFEETEEYIYLEFDTAWSPPVEFCELLSKRYGVCVKIKYIEPGMVISGIFEVNDKGEILRDENYQNILEGIYNYDKSMFWDEIKNLVEHEIIDISKIDKEDNLIENYLPFLTLDDIIKLKKNYIRKL